MPFAVASGSGFDLTQIDIGLTHNSTLPGANSATVQLVMDNGGVPGSFIQSWALSNLPEFGTSTLHGSQMITGISGTLLNGTSQNWLIAIGSSTSMGWILSNPEIV